MLFPNVIALRVYHVCWQMCVVLGGFAPSEKLLNLEGYSRLCGAVRGLNPKRQRPWHNGLHWTSTEDCDRRPQWVSMVGSSRLWHAMPSEGKRVASASRQAVYSREVLEVGRGGIIHGPRPAQDLKRAQGQGVAHSTFLMWDNGAALGVRPPAGSRQSLQARGS